MQRFIRERKTSYLRNVIISVLIFLLIFAGFGCGLTAMNKKMDQEEILRRIRPYLGEEAHIKVEIVDEIPVLASGKRKYIENRCEKYQQHKGFCG